MEPSIDTGAIMERLKFLGLTKYEALVYTALLSVEGATASEIHELSGVPRASAYPVLDRLLQKNLVSVSYTTPKQFSATPPDEGVTNLLTTIEGHAESVKHMLGEIYRQRNRAEHGRQELIWSIYGRENILHRLNELIASANSEVKILCTGNLLEKNLLETLENRNGTIRIDILTDRVKGQLPKFSTGSIATTLETTKFSSRDIAGVCIIDDRSAFVVMGSADETPAALYSESNGFIQFFLRYWSIFSEIRRT
jgi:sugar-specific transcriptional regulator TrmB